MIIVETHLGVFKWSSIFNRTICSTSRIGSSSEHRGYSGLAEGIEPMICLYHFDILLARAEEYNGFVFKKVVMSLSDRVRK